MKASRPYEVWEVDITYIPAGESWACCYTVLDVFTREWAGYTLSTTATATAAVEALLDAMHRHPGADPAKLAIRSDHGSQYTSREFNSAISTLGLKHEYIWYKTPQQNGHLESFHGKLKFEYVWPADPESFQEAEEIIQGAFVDYNERRVHSAIGYVPGGGKSHDRRRVHFCYKSGLNS
ncbi:MAG: DDE-type integrase/transposase/recombinase [Nitrosopumilaceae archaeon]|nr:DDE-type integrase/transposase/recombinase [Nitrosopumilaceae archaeon]